MGVVDWFKSRYRNIDRSVGGVLPGGYVKEKETTYKETQIEPEKTAVRSIDVVDSGGKSAGGITIKGRDAWSPSSSSSSGRRVQVSSSGNVTQEQAQTYAESEGYKVQEQQQPINNNAGRLEPGTTAVTGTSNYYVGNPPPRYNMPVTQALGTSLKRVWTEKGRVGFYGVGNYLDYALVDPWRYVGKPKAYQTVSNYGGGSRFRNLAGGMFGFGLTTSEKVTGSNKNNPRYYDIGEQKTRETYRKAGLTFTGEPVEVLPTRLGEDVVRKTKPTYEDKLEGGIEELRVYYQGKVDAGTMTKTEAEKQFKQSAELYSGNINTQFEKEVSSSYTSRYSNVKDSIGEVADYNKKIFEPPAPKIIKGIGKGAETAAIIGTIQFGGGVGAIAAGSYLAGTTLKQGVDLRRESYFMTPTQKALGAASFGVGVAATAYALNVGYNRVYADWYNIAETDLMNKRAGVKGVEAIRYKDYTRVNTIVERKTALDTSQTISSTKIMGTGKNRIGFVSKGFTRTAILDPKTEKYIVTYSKYTSSGNIPNVLSGGLGVGNKKVMVGAGKKATYGLADAKITSGGKTIDTKFVTVSTNEGGYYGVAGGEANKLKGFYKYDTVVDFGKNTVGKVKTGIANVKATSPIDYTGKIFKRATPSGSSNNIINVGGKKALTTTTKGGFSEAVSASATSTAQKINIVDTPKIVTQASQAPTVLTSRTAPLMVSKSSSIERQEPRTSQLTYTLPKLSDVTAPREALSPVVVTSSSFKGASASANIQAPATAVIPAITPALTPRLINSPKAILRGGILTPGATPAFNFTTTQPPPTFRGGGFPFNFALSPGGFDLPANIVRGGQRVTSYSPSYSALVFNLKGQAPKTNLKTGIGFRPITPGFQFKTGLSSIGFRRFLKL